MHPKHLFGRKELIIIFWWVKKFFYVYIPIIRTSDMMCRSISCCANALTSINILHFCNYH